MLKKVYLTCSLLLTIVLLLASSSTTLAQSHDEEPDLAAANLYPDIHSSIISELESNGIDAEYGTPKFTEALRSILRNDLVILNINKQDAKAYIYTYLRIVPADDLQSWIWIEDSLNALFLPLVIAQGNSFIEEKVESSQVKSTLYDREAAVNYAKKHVFAYNNDFGNFSGGTNGGDCTNFASQIAFAGGVPMTKVEGTEEWWRLRGGSQPDNANWFYKQRTLMWADRLVRDIWSESWTQTDSFRRYMVSAGNAKVYSFTFDPYSFPSIETLAQPGDFIQFAEHFAWNGDFATGHTTVVTGHKDGKLQMAYHSREKKDVTLQDFYDFTVPLYQVVLLIKMNNVVHDYGYCAEVLNSSLSSESESQINTTQTCNLPPNEWRYDPDDPPPSTTEPSAPQVCESKNELPIVVVQHLSNGDELCAVVNESVNNFESEFGISDIHEIWINDDDVTAIRAYLEPNFGGSIHTEFNDTDTDVASNPLGSSLKSLRLYWKTDSCGDETEDGCYLFFRNGSCGLFRESVPDFKETPFKEIGMTAGYCRGDYDGELYRKPGREGISQELPDSKKNFDERFPGNEYRQLRLWKISTCNDKSKPGIYAYDDHGCKYYEGEGLFVDISAAGQDLNKLIAKGGYSVRPCMNVDGSVCDEFDDGEYDIEKRYRSMFIFHTNTLPNIPLLVNPSQGAEVQATNPVTLCFESGDDADGDGLNFQMRVFSPVVNGQRTQIYFKDRTLETCHRLESLTPGLYEWDVRALDFNKFDMKWSTRMEASFQVVEPMATPVPTLTPTPTPIPPQDHLIDSFENDSHGWYAKPNNNALTVQRVQQHMTHGTHSGKVSFSNGYWAHFQKDFAPSIDASSYKGIQFSVFNPGRQRTIRLGVGTGSDHKWHQSSSKPLLPGSNTLEFDFQSDWSESIISLNNMKYVALIIDPAAEEGEAYLDEIQFTGAVGEPVSVAYFESFENGLNGWEYDNTSDATAITTVEQNSSDGSFSAQMNFVGGYWAQYQNDFEASQDWLNYNRISLGFTNPGQQIEVSLAIGTGESYVWHRSNSKPLITGSHGVIFDLENDWGSLITDLDNIKYLHIIIRPGSTNTNSVFVDSIKVYDAAADVNATSSIIQDRIHSGLLYLPFVSR